jgi:hypothetical protein
VSGGVSKWTLQISNCRSNNQLVPRLCLGTYCLRGSASSALVLCCLLVLSGCGKTPARDSVNGTQGDLPPPLSVAENGPVKLTAEVTPAPARLSDEPVLALTIEAERGVEIDKPDFGEEIGEFKIVASREPVVKMREGRQIYQRILTLEPGVAGRLAIDPISVTFRDKRSGADGNPQTVATKPLMVEITSAYTKETPSLSDLRAAADPIALPRRVPGWCWAIVAAVIALGLLAFFVWGRRRREKAAMAIVLSPEELASLELQKLAASGLMETDVKLFFVELTAIVRRYIERTTGIRAPEQTTEEFLRDMRRVQRSAATAGLPSSETIDRLLGTAGQASSGTLQFSNGARFSVEALESFLESADLVKFAAYRPRREDIEESFRRAEAFVGARTREAPVAPQEAVA